MRLVIASLHGKHGRMIRVGFRFDFGPRKCCEVALRSSNQDIDAVKPNTLHAPRPVALGRQQWEYSLLDGRQGTCC